MVRYPAVFKRSVPVASKTTLSHPILQVVTKVVLSNRYSPGKGQVGHTEAVGHHRHQHINQPLTSTSGYQPYNGVDPVSDMEVDMLDIRLNSAPSRKYYNLVMGVYDAVQAGLLTPIGRTYSIGDRYIETELYKVKRNDHEVRLPSAKAIASAKVFFDREMQAEHQKRLEEERKKKHETTRRKTVKIKKSNNNNCNFYEQLLNDIFPLDYLEDPIRDLQIHNLKIDLNSKPGEHYFTQVLKVNDAVRKRLLRPKPRTWNSGEKGIETQLYKYGRFNTEVRLVSHKARAQATIFFTRKVERECDVSSEEHSSSNSKVDADSSEDYSDKTTASSDTNEENTESTSVHKVNVHVTASVHSNSYEDLPNHSHKCYTPEAVKHFREEMRNVDVDSKPGTLYFRLVLRVNRAVHCNLLVAIRGTLHIGKNGVHTELFRVMEDNSKVRLASVNDRYRARAFFHANNSANKEIQHEIAIESSTFPTNTELKHGPTRMNSFHRGHSVRDKK